MPEGWEWDETLFRGSAPFYTRGRLSYSPRLADQIAARIGLDGTGRLLDLGCGPGTVTLPFARLFSEVVGLDPDHGMLEEAALRAEAAGITNARWVCARAEEIGPDFGALRVATIAQSFHWMDRPLVASTLLQLLEPSGWLLHIAERARASGIDAPPYEAIGELVKRYLGPERRAGQGVLRSGTPGGEKEILIGAGFIHVETMVIPGEGSVERTSDDLVAWVFSRSNSAPHLFGERLEEFEMELRRLLRGLSPESGFLEALPDTVVEMYRPR